MGVMNEWTFVYVSIFLPSFFCDAIYTHECNVFSGKSQPTLKT